MKQILNKYLNIFSLRSQPRRTIALLHSTSEYGFQRPSNISCIYACALLLLLSILNTGAYADNQVAPEEDFLEASEAFQPSLLIDNDELKVEWHIEKGYFLYRHGFKASAQKDGIKTDLLLESSDGVKKYDEFFEKEVMVYHKSASTQINLGALLGQAFQLTLTSQGCADAGLCFPPTNYHFQVDASGIISTSKTAFQPISTVDTSLNQKAPASFNLIFTIIGAFIGGLILNLMPCVFPVLSLKALSFASGHSSPKSQRQHGWAYTAGVIGSFLVAAITILVARAAGESLGWGFQLQHPIFVTLMIYLFFTMGLSLSGFIEFGGSLMGAGQKLTAGSNLQSSFFTGVLAALVASPCTAPFMATALGVALTQPMFISLIIFTALGLGMAFPFLLLSYSPKLAKLMPRPGNWMITFKQALAFPLYLTSIWLLWVLSHQAGPNAVIITLVGILLITISAWIISLPSTSKLAHILLKTMALLLLLPAGLIAFDATSKEQSTSPSSADTNIEAYTLDRLNAYREQGTPVLVDLTADWCLTCKVNERVAFTDTVKDTLKRKGAVLLVGDWTNKNSEIEVLLKQHQRSGVPLYLMYPKNGGEPEMLPQLLSEQMVLDAINRAVL